MSHISSIHSERKNPLLSEFWQHRRAMLVLVVFSILMIASPKTISANGDESYISTERGEGRFTLSASGKSAPICVSSQDYPGVIRILKHLQADIGGVSNAEPALLIDSIPASQEIILVGTLGKSPLIDKLVEEKELNVQGIAGRWETFLIQIVQKPLPNVNRALVIAGSDKRGTIYGVYDLSANIGVSPWHWWADVPVRRHPELYVLPGRHTQGEPAVKYRGIFINDEAPALSGWAYEKFGGFNGRFYEKVFELILRLRGNYLWPAMWGRAFSIDDPINPRLADEYGIVIGTSHHEPMMRAHDEWRQFGKGVWNYEKNDSVLKEFWKQGIRRMGSNESIVTIGMRGDGDEPMSEGANIALLERIVKDQRQILGEVTGRDVASIPQLWALYKEVQEYYDKGMRVPDDVTLLLCDDNWGNIRKLPMLGDKRRSGGYGIYYHYDYVGGPRNYKWLNTNQIARVWEQMHLAYSSGVDRIWIVNVGDIKPMEFPIEFFLDYAWNPDRWPAERLPEYTQQWAQQQFGPEYSKDIADILTKYTKYNARRKPELLSPDTYSLVSYREAETVVSDYNALAEKARRISDSLAPEYRDAFYQLVLHPVLACSNLNELYVTVGRNRLYADQGRVATNLLAEKARRLFDEDSAITYYYNRVMAGGKWDHIMDQTHIGYTYWQQPEKNSMPNVKEIPIPTAADMGVAIEGSTNWWPKDSTEAVLPEFDPYNQQSYYIEVFNRGRTPFKYFVQSGKPWVKISKAKGKIETEDRLRISVDWKKAPSGIHHVPVAVEGPNKSRVIVYAVIKNPLQPRVVAEGTTLSDRLLAGAAGGGESRAQTPKWDRAYRFIESNGCVSIEAEHYAQVVNTSSLVWQHIPDLGRTLSGMTPVTVPNQLPGGDNPHLEYRMQIFSTGEIIVRSYLSPTLNFHNDQGLRYAISFDDDQPQIINMHADGSNQKWEAWVSDNINVEVSHHKLEKPGAHVLKFWAIDPGVVLQKIVVETSELRPSYLGPPESFYGAIKYGKGL